MNLLENIVNNHVWVLIPFGLFAFLTISAIADSIRKSAQTRQREVTRRELAAYVAEGTMSPKDATALMEAGSKKGWRCGPMFNGGEEQAVT